MSRWVPTSYLMKSFWIPLLPWNPGQLFGRANTVTEERETYFKRSRTKDIEIVFFSHLINNNHLMQVTAKPLRKWAGNYCEILTIDGVTCWERELRLIRMSEKCWIMMRCSGEWGDRPSSSPDFGGGVQFNDLNVCIFSPHFEEKVSWKKIFILIKKYLLERTEKDKRRHIA